MTAAHGSDAVARALLDARGTIVVCAHERPDGDAVGSVLGLVLALRSLDRPAVGRLVDDGELSRAYTALPGAGWLRVVDPDEECDVLVALDTTGLERLGAAAALADKARMVVAIDHHPDNQGFGDPDWIDPEAPAVGAQIWELLPALGVTADADIATCLYVALMTDTGRFLHDNTTPRAFRIASEMADAGARVMDVSRDVFLSRPAGATALLGRVLSRLTLANDGAVAYSWLTDDDLTTLEVSPADTEDLVDQVRMTAGPRVALLAKVGNGTTRLSFRSKDGTDVAAIARLLGGGGHRAAAGATLEGGLDDALAAVLPLLPGPVE